MFAKMNAVALRTFHVRACACPEPSRRGDVGCKDRTGRFTRELPMKDRLLITAAAAALIAGTTLASAQPGQGGSPGAAERGGSGTMERSNGGQGTAGQGAVERGPAREGAPQQRTGQSREQRPAQMRDQNQGQ